MSNGGPAPEAITNKMYEYSTKITEYKIADIPNVSVAYHLYFEKLLKNCRSISRP